MLSNPNDTEKVASAQNFSNLNNSNLITPNKSKSNQDGNNSLLNANTAMNTDINSTSVIFSNIINSPRLSNLISENSQDNQVQNMNNIETQNEEKNTPDENKERKNSIVDNIILSDSDEDEEIQSDKITPQNKNELNNTESQKSALQENQKPNENNSNNKVNGVKNTNKNGVNEKDKFIDTETQNSKNIERKLYYLRKISSNRKYKIRGKDKLNIQFFIGNLKPFELLPNFVFSSEKYYFVPHKCRQVTQNYKGYLISFPGLKKSLYDKIIKKDLEHLCTYYFKRPRRKQTSVDIQVKDEKTLNDGVFLNDGIVNFYLKIIEDEYTFGENKENNVLVLKSYFYNFIANQQNLNLSTDNFTYPDSCSFVKTKINVFSYKTVIIPTCENYHWSLIIVNDIDKMKNIFSESSLKAFREQQNFTGLGIGEPVKEEENEDYPEIFYLDSFYDISQRRMLIILKYLFYEYQKIYNIDVNMHNYLLKNYYKIECYNPDVPKQNNTYDCGIFLLMYAELFLYNPSYFLQHISKKYKINKKEENKANNDANNMNNNAIISNNMNNNININNPINAKVNDNMDNAINGQKEDNNKINKNTINNTENSVPNNNIIIKKDETFIETENNIDNEGEEHKIEMDIEKIDIQVENIKINDNDEKYIENNEYPKNGNTTVENNLNGNNDLNNPELEQEENSIRNWFSYDLVNAQRTKIKNLINELSKIEKKKELSQKMKEQNEIIEKYMAKQKEEFDKYFSNLND